MGSFLTLRNELFEETVVRGDKARNFIGKGRPGREQWGKAIQENYSATWFALLGFKVVGLASPLSLASHSDSRVLRGGALIAQPR